MIFNDYETFIFDLDGTICNTKYKITFTDGDGFVKLDKVQTYSTMPTDYWFTYEPDSIKPLVHPDETNKFVLPEGIISMLIESDDFVEID